MSTITIDPFFGQHCETTATGTLLNSIGIHHSEPFLFGIGQGLGYIFWKMKSLDFPFIGGRIKTDSLTENICQNLCLDLNIKETRSVKKAWKNLSEPLSQKKVVGLKLDCFHLEYFTQKIHFAGHYVACYGLDSTQAYLIDTEQQGGRVQTALSSLALARAERGPMSSANRSYTISKSSGYKKPNLKTLIPKVIKSNALDYLNPPISNLGYKGILKTAQFIDTWLPSDEGMEKALCTAALLMEKAGTGGSLFRNFYKDFLLESYHVTLNAKLLKAYESFIKIAQLWKEVSIHLDKAGKTENLKHLSNASNILKDLAILEKEAMELLYGL